MDPERQVIKLPEYQKAIIGPYTNGHMGLENGFYVPFNPAEISIEEAIGISDVPQISREARRNRMKEGRSLGMSYPTENSLSGREKGLTTLSTTLFFNTLNDLYQTSYEDVRDDIRKLYPYTNAAEKYGKSGGRRPKAHAAQQIYFFWGTIAVAGMLRQMSVHYTMFASGGNPVRAQVQITIEGFYVGEESSRKSPAVVKAAGGPDAVLMTGSLSDWKANYCSCQNPRKLL